MSIIGEFTSIPTGTVHATITHDRLEAPFVMQAQFRAEDSDSCKYGEYRQYVRGQFRANNIVVPHSLCDSVFLDPDRFQEDGCRPPGCTAYGYRECNGTKSRYLPDQLTGGTFQGEDEPGIRAKPDTRVYMNLEFRAYLIDKRTNQVLAEAAWTVFGEGVIMAETPKPHIAASAPEKREWSAGARYDAVTGGWVVDLRLAGRPGPAPILSSDLEVEVLDGDGRELDVDERPSGLLVEVGNARRVTSIATYRLSPGQGRPVRLVVRSGEVRRELTLEALNEPDRAR